MPDLNQLLGSGGRISRLARIALGLQEQLGIETASPELQATFEVFARAENLLYAGEKLCVGFAVIGAGGAGNISELALTNPADSGILAIVNRIIFGASGDQVQVRVASATTLGTAQNTTGFRDLRIGIATATVQPVCKLTSKNGDGTTVGFEIARMPNALFSWEVEFVFPPASSLVFTPTTANAALTIDAILWRERPATPDELARSA